MPPVPVSVADSPAQIMPSLLVVPDVSVTLMTGVGSGLTVMIVEVEVVQPLELVTVTV